MITFNSVAMELNYGSPQIEGVYALLDLFGKGEQIIHTSVLKANLQHLPLSFHQWILDHEDVNIVFEARVFPNDNVFHDWELIMNDD